MYVNRFETISRDCSAKFKWRRILKAHYRPVRQKLKCEKFNEMEHFLKFKAIG